MEDTERRRSPITFTPALFSHSLFITRDEMFSHARDRGGSPIQKMLQRILRVASIEEWTMTNLGAIFSDLPSEIHLKYLSFLSPRDLFLGYGLASKDCKERSLDKSLTPTVRVGAKPNETAFDFILRILQALPHDCCGPRNRLEFLDLCNIIFTIPTRSKLHEVRLAIENSPLLGVHYLSFPHQSGNNVGTSIPHQSANIVKTTSISHLVSLMMPTMKNLKSYECHSFGSQITYSHRMLTNLGRLERFRSDKNFVESPLGFHVRDTGILEVSIESGVFLTSRFEFECDRLFFLSTDHVQLEKVNIAGAVQITRFAIVPVPQSVLMDFIRLNRSLRWIKCDLDLSNVALMKAEHPDVTFDTSHMEV